MILAWKLPKFKLKTLRFSLHVFEFQSFLLKSQEATHLEEGRTIMLFRPNAQLSAQASLILCRHRSVLAHKSSHSSRDRRSLPDNADSPLPTPFDVQLMVRKAVSRLQKGQIEEDAVHYLALLTGAEREYIRRKVQEWIAELGGGASYPGFVSNDVRAPYLVDGYVDILSIFVQNYLIMPVFRWSSSSLIAQIHVAGVPTVSRRVCRIFLEWLRYNTSSDSIRQKIDVVLKVTRLSNPEEWYPTARSGRRKLILHVGPTNSGKTYRALQALCNSGRGAYAGPLRLLAFEVFDRLNKGDIAGLSEPISCNLVTGDETQIVDEHAKLTSCTVEMLPLNKRFDVAVIDEIQMLGDPSRGSAWTTAVLGVQAKEVHLCGEESAVPLIKEIAKLTQDEVIVNKYDRLGPLKLQEATVGRDLSNIRKGDCVVAFSRNQIYTLKKGIEDKTGLRVALAYGQLPGEVRAEQASRFNNQKYDVIVGSDALGMGLNL